MNILRLDCGKVILEKKDFQIEKKQNLDAPVINDEIKIELNSKYINKKNQTKK